MNKIEDYKIKFKKKKRKGNSPDTTNKTTLHQQLWTALFSCEKLYVSLTLGVSLNSLTLGVSLNSGRASVLRVCVSFSWVPCTVYETHKYEKREILL